MMVGFASNTVTNRTNMLTIVNTSIIEFTLCMMKAVVVSANSITAVFRKAFEAVRHKVTLSFAV